MQRRADGGEKLLDGQGGTTLVDSGWIDAGAHRRSVAVLAVVGMLALGGTAAGCGGVAPRRHCVSDADCAEASGCFKGRCRPLSLWRRQHGDELASSGTAQRLGQAKVPDVGKVRMVMGGPQRHGRSGHVGPATQPRSLWRISTGSRIRAQPLWVSDDCLLVALMGGELRCLSPADGSSRWRFRVDAGLGSAPALSTAAVSAAGEVWVTAADGTVMALRLKGQRQWRLPLGSGTAGLQLQADPLVDGQRLYIAGQGLAALATTGELLWHFATPGYLRSSPALHPNGLVVVGTPEGTLLAVDRRGERRWESTAYASVDAGVAISPDGHVVAANQLGDVLSWTIAGQERWRYRAAAAVLAAPAIATDGTVIVGDLQGQLHAIADDGTRRWRLQLPGPLHAAARIDAAGRIFVGGRDATLYAIAPDGTVLWQRPMSNDVDAAVELGADGTLYVATDDGSVEALR